MSNGHHRADHRADHPAGEDDPCRGLPLRRGYVDLDVGQVHHRHRPPSGGGPRTVLLLLHQTAASSAMFEALAAELPPGWGLLAPDTPGFGQSFRPAAAYSVDDWAGWLVAYLDALGVDRVHVLGHHTGAAIAARLAAVAPQRVASLTMVGAVALPEAERRAWHAGVRALVVDDDGSHLDVAWHQVGHIDASPVRYPPSTRLRHREVVDKLTAGERWHEAYLAVFSHDTAADLAQVRCPALLVCGDEDVLQPYVAHTRAAMPAMRHVGVAAGGYVLDQQPDLVVGPLVAHVHAAAG